MQWARRIGERGLKLAILSNMPAEMRVPINERHAAWLADFPIRLFSCDVGCAKPDSAIFRMLLERLGVPADRVLFLDDSLRNVEGARRAGLRAIHFTTYDALRAEPLSALGLPVPDER